MATLAQKKTALLIIDFQEDFCPPNGSLAVKEGRDIAPVINDLLTWPGFAFKLATRDWHPANHVSFASSHSNATPFASHTIHNPSNPEETQTTLLWPDHCIQSTPGAELISELDQTHLDHILDKGTDARVESYSAFGPPFRSPRVGDTGLEALLRERGITEVVVVGLAWDYCVKCTALDAVEAGFGVKVVEEATRPVSGEKWEETRAELERGGVRVVGVEDLIGEGLNS